MIVYLDANIVIYFVEQSPAWGPKTTARLAARRGAGDEIAVSDATRLECLVGPLASGNAALLADYTAFFASPAVHLFAVTGPAWERAARIRAT